MKRGFAIAVILIAGLLLSAGCDKPAAVVNKKKIDRRMLEQRVKERAYEFNRRQIAFSDRELRGQVLREMIDDSLILEEAKKRGIVVTDQEISGEVAAIRKMLGENEYQKMLESLAMSEDAFRLRTRERMIVLKFAGSMIAPSSVPDEELRSRYQASQKPFFKSAKVLMRLIEAPTEEKAQAIAAEIRTNKAEFASVADRYAKSDPSIMHTAGWTSPDYFGPPISDAMKELKVGQFGGPYRGKKGYFLIRIDDRKKEEIASFDEVKESIRNELLEERRQAAVAIWVAEARKSASIQESGKGTAQ